MVNNTWQTSSTYRPGMPEYSSIRNVGVLALQGDFAAHIRALAFYGISAAEIRTADDLELSESLIIPGGESSTLLKLLTSELRDQLMRKAALGMPILATCAGAILLAGKVENPSQESLGLIDITVRRNAYGRQSESFIEKDLEYQTLPNKDLNNSKPAPEGFSREGIFIRAPRITDTGTKVRTILTRNKEAVMVQQDNIIAACFHPELSAQPHVTYQSFFDIINSI